MKDGNTDSGSPVRNNTSSSTTPARYIPPHLRGGNNQQTTSSDSSKDSRDSRGGDYRNNDREYRNERDFRGGNNSDFRG